MNKHDDMPLAAPGNLDKDIEKTLKTFKRQKRGEDGVTANEFFS